MSQEPKVIIQENGPYLVYGKIPLIEGRTNNELPSEEVMALCRCGQSENKPFCDGTHVKVQRKAE